MGLCRNNGNKLNKYHRNVVPFSTFETLHIVVAPHFHMVSSSCSSGWVLPFLGENRESICIIHIRDTPLDIDYEAMSKATDEYYPPFLTHCQHTVRQSPRMFRAVPQARRIDMQNLVKQNHFLHNKLNVSSFTIWCDCIWILFTIMKIEKLKKNQPNVSRPCMCLCFLLR